MGLVLVVKARIAYSRATGCSRRICVSTAGLRMHLMHAQASLLPLNAVVLMVAAAFANGAHLGPTAHLSGVSHLVIASRLHPSCPVNPHTPLQPHPPHHPPTHPPTNLTNQPFRSPRSRTR